MHVKFEVCSVNSYEAISIYRPKKLEGHVTLATPPFGKILRGHVQTVPANACQI